MKVFNSLLLIFVYLTVVDGGVFVFVGPEESPTVSPTTPTISPTEACPVPAGGIVCAQVYNPVRCSENDCEYFNICFAGGAGQDTDNCETFLSSGDFYSSGDVAADACEENTSCGDCYDDPECRWSDGTCSESCTALVSCYGQFENYDSVCENQDVTEAKARCYDINGSGVDECKACLESSEYCSFGGMNGFDSTCVDNDQAFNMQAVGGNLYTFVSGDPDSCDSTDNVTASACEENTSCGDCYADPECRWSVGTCSESCASDVSCYGQFEDYDSVCDNQDVTEAKARCYDINGSGVDECKACLESSEYCSFGGMNGFDSACVDNDQAFNMQAVGGNQYTFVSGELEVDSCGSNGDVVVAAGDDAGS